MKTSYLLALLLAFVGIFRIAQVSGVSESKSAEKAYSDSLHSLGSDSFSEQEPICLVSKQAVDFYDSGYHLSDYSYEFDFENQTIEGADIIEALLKGDQFAARKKIETWLYEDFDTAINWIARHPNLKDTKFIADLISASINEHFEPLEAIEKLSAISGFTEVYLQTSLNQFDRWIHSSPSQAEAWIVEEVLADQPNEANHLFVESLAKYYFFVKTPEEALSASLQFPEDSSVREQFLQSIYVTWAQYAPNDFGELIQDLPRSRARDVGVLAYIEELKSFSPESAMHCVDYIDNGNLKACVLEELMHL